MKKLFLLLALCVSMLAMATEGALTGKFTINADGDQIVFSQGNLQYMPLRGTWRFAANQYDTIGADNINRDVQRYTGWIDLFGYGKGNDPLGYPEGSEINSGGDVDYNDYGANAISNGGNAANLWRTLTKDEWFYIFSTRPNAAQKIGQATVEGIHGCVLLPDDWTLPQRLTFTPKPNDWTTNVYTTGTWGLMEANGAVFLPAAGTMNQYTPAVNNVNVSGTYMAITNNMGGGNGYFMHFEETRLLGACGSWMGYLYAVRLVQAAPVPVTPTCPEAHFYLNGAEVTAINLTVGQSMSVPTILTADGNILRATGSILDPTIAQLGADNMIYGMSAGTTYYQVVYMPVAGDASLVCTYEIPIVVSAATSTCPTAHFSGLGADNVLHMEVGDVVSIPELVGATGSVLHMSAKTVEGIRVAVLTEDDMIQAVGPGNATFIGLVTSLNGQTLNCEYSFDIVVTSAQPQKQSPELSFDETELYTELGMTFTPPTFHNPHNVPINKWNSQNMNVAEVSEDGSIVTIKAVGDAYIFCESFETDTYYAQSVGYTIHVTTTGLTVAGVLVNSGNAQNIVGNGTAWYDEPNRTLYLSGFNYTGQNILNGAPAHVKAAGSGVNAAIIYTPKDNIPLTIMVDSAVFIRNAETCIYAPNTPVVMMGSDRGGYMTMDATSVAVSAVAYKIHQCWVSASGGSAALALGQELGMSRGSYLLATSNGVAIQCHSFVKTTEVVDGYEIDVLTEGVYFQENYGFFSTNKQFAKVVEIGKKAVVVPNDEITTIDFTQTDPEGNESVIFSADVDNTFNEETGQLELSTSLTDEEVADALENLLPGSSAWVSALPGSIVFDIPAGQGTIKVQFMTFPGYTLRVLVEGTASVSISSAELGWSRVDYNVPTPVHVVIYLHAESGAGAPARISTNQNDVANAGAYVQAVMILPAEAPGAANDHTAIDIIDANNGENGKIMLNGQLFIIREGRVFNAAGAQVK